MSLGELYHMLYIIFNISFQLVFQQVHKQTTLVSTPQLVSYFIPRPWIPKYQKQKRSGMLASTRHEEQPNPILDLTT